MITTGGNGSWSTIENLLEPIQLPKMVKVRQIQPHPPAVDVEAEIIRQIAEKNLLAPIKAGDTVAITCGSRGIANMPLAVKTMVRLIKEVGGDPFLVPAMGSHAGATAEGQTQMLIGMGYGEEEMGAPIRATMETVELDHTDDGLPVLCDKYAAEADHLVVMNRIKPHVCFRGPYESGLMKMFTIGLGKQKGANIAHSLGFGHMPHHIPDIGNKSIAKLNVLCAIGLIENAFHDTAVCKVLAKDEIAKEEPALLDQAKSFAAYLFFDQLDTLIIDEVGKNISGSGFDTNVVGRYHSEWVSGGPKIKRVVILDISKASKGNGNGIGMADFTTRRAVEKFDFAQTYPNTLTATLTGSVKIPMTLPNDLQAIKSCVKTSNLVDFADVTMVRIHNTLCLDEIEVSENLLPQIRDDARFEILSEPYEMVFDQDGNLF
ncbi:lactate racemase domain-containing protein [Bengtsoniella intestinalis]|uniref:lactate racemase domain-containing protein n=1 Tax=Bengtsoniella intestinalis TaxID=3073143 RepID=UPI00391FBDC7